MGCYIWYSEDGPGRAAAAPPSPPIAAPNVTTYPSTASVPTSHYSMWHDNYISGLRVNWTPVTTRTTYLDVKTHGAASRYHERLVDLLRTHRRVERAQKELEQPRAADVN